MRRVAHPDCACRHAAAAAEAAAPGGTPLSLLDGSGLVNDEYHSLFPLDAEASPSRTLGVNTRQFKGALGSSRPRGGRPFAHARSLVA